VSLRGKGRASAGKACASLYQLGAYDAAKISLETALSGESWRETKHRAYNSRKAPPDNKKWQYELKLN